MNCHFSVLAQGGVVYKVGGPMEKHAAKIYTRTMFEKFQEVLYKSASYYIDELVPGEVYRASHFDSGRREKWYKVEYKVLVHNGYYTCECGMYEHMGMLCCHVVKVRTVLWTLFHGSMCTPEKIQCCRVRK
jgi:hypothetical protein